MKLLLGEIPGLKIYLGKCNFVLVGEGLALAGVHLPEVLQVRLVPQEDHLPEAGGEGGEKTAQEFVLVCLIA